VARGGFGGLPERRLVGANPLHERLCFGDVGHPKHRRAGHPGLRDPGGRPAGGVDHRAAAVDGRDERPLRRRQREVPVAGERAAVDGHGSRHAQRDRDPTDHVVDVGSGRRGVEPVVSDGVEVGTGP
jgi:hypothetical protein